MAGARLTGDLTTFSRVRLTDAQRMRHGASRLAVQIAERTRSGRDAQGRAFRPYSPAYAKRKGSTKVNLISVEAHPHMLDGLDVLSATKNRAEIGWHDGDLADRAAFNEAGGTHRPKREFLGASEAMLDELVEYLEAGISL